MIILKSKYQNSAKLCFMNTDSLIILMQTEDFYEDIANHVKKWVPIMKLIGHFQEV